MTVPKNEKVFIV